MAYLSRIFLAAACSALAATHSSAQTIAMADPVPLVNIPPKVILPDAEVDAPVSQLEQRYKLHYKVDIPVTAVGAIWSGFAFSKIYDKPESSVADIAALNKDDLNKLDRWAAGMHNENADANSNYLFYGSIPLPFLLLADKKIRHDAPKIGFMYLESMAITGLLYTGGDYFIDRYRPETYRTDKTPAEKTGGNYRNAFFAGHVALVGTATFFMAKIYNDYHPHNGFKYVVWGVAIAATGTTAYLRHIAGKHFPTDIAVGTAIGVLSGVLVPELHKNKKFTDRGLGLSPTMIQDKPGFCLSYRFK